MTFPRLNFLPTKTPPILRRSEVYPHPPARITIFKFIYKLYNFSNFFEIYHYLKMFTP